MAKRQEFTRGVANEIAERARNAIGAKICEWCLAVTAERQLHHLEQDAMKSADAKKKPLTARDGVMLCLPCHKLVNREQAVVFNKSERVRARFNGVERKPKGNAKLAAASPRRRATTPVEKSLPRRPLFEIERLNAIEATMPMSAMLRGVTTVSGRILSLEWVLNSSTPAPVASEEEIVEEMLVAHRRRIDSYASEREAIRAAFAVAKRHLGRE